MRILLDEEDSKKWLHMLECEKALEKSSRFHANWPSHHREEIMAMYDAGKYPREIAQELGMNMGSVKHLVYAEKKKSRFNVEDHRKSTKWIEEASQKLAANESTKPVAFAEGNADDVTEALRTLVGGRYSIVYIRDKLNREFDRNYTLDDIVKMRSEL